MRLFWRLLLLFNFLCFCIIGTYEQEDLTDAIKLADGIDDFFMDFSSTTSASVDAMAEMYKIRATTAQFLKAGTAVTSFFAKGVIRQIPFKKDSDEYNLAVTLHEKQMVLVREYWQMLKNVDVPLDGLKFYMKILTDPDRIKTNFDRMEFARRCTTGHEYSPISALRKIYFWTSQECKKPEEWESMILAEGMNVFNKIRFDQISRTDDEEGAKIYRLRTQLIQHQLASLSLESSSGILRSIRDETENKSYLTFDNVLKVIEKFVQKLPGNETSSCFLKMVIETSGYSREPVSRMIDMIKAQTIQLHLQPAPYSPAHSIAPRNHNQSTMERGMAEIAELCSNITCLPDPDCMIAFRNESQTLTNDVLKTLDKYEYVWPNVTKEVVENMLKERREDLYPKNLARWQEVANVIRESLDRRGNTKLVVKESVPAPSLIFFKRDSFDVKN
uniref:Uncharacterized protein n=1 Tax=Ditylenchus dipsaci TaxID=166011 RepID=A0A915DVZ3_9BILA